MEIADHSIPASAFVKAFQRNRIEQVLTVPDWVQLALHRRLEDGVEGIDVLNCASENQVVTVGAGLAIGGRKSLLMMQNQGLYNCLNSLRAVSLDARIPLVLLVGQFGREFDNFDADPRTSRRTMVRIMEPVLQAFGLPFFRLDSEVDLLQLDRAFALAKEQGTAVVLLVSAPVAWS